MNASLSATRMPLLFARYVAGQISEKTWQAFTEVMDAIEASEERVALAAFLDDAIADLGTDAIKLPKQAEVESVVKSVRWAA
jgi:hypothetical protein